MTLSWNTAMCERCWIDRRGVWVPGDGAAEVLAELPIPVRLKLPDGEMPVERCGWCGSPTFVGIFVRVDPTTIPWPSEEPDG